MKSELWLYALVCVAGGAAAMFAVSIAQPPASCWPVHPSRPMHQGWPHNG